MNEDTNNNLIWLDLEMTGLGDEHVILEVAIIITDEKLNITDRFPDSELGLAIKRSEDELSKMKIPVKATFHPAYLLKNPYEKKKMWDDLLKINAYISKNNLI